MAIAPGLINPICVTCDKCGKIETIELQNFYAWLGGRGYYLCYECSGQRTFDDFDADNRKS